MSRGYSLFRRARSAGTGRQSGRRRFHRGAAGAACLLAGVLLAGSGLVAPTTAFAVVSVTQGAINGRAMPAANLTVKVTNVNTSFTRSATVGPKGGFSLSNLPPGTYTVELQQNGQTIATQKGITVIAGSGTTVNFAAQQATKLSTITVTSNVINPIDITSSNSSLNVTASQVNELPVQHNIFNVALLAPTVNANPAFAPPSFGGASSAENSYYVNGMNVTDNLDFLRLAEPPFEALNSFQIMTGGVSAAYGNAMGGVINMVTKSGSNTFHSGVNMYWEPRPLHFSSPNVVAGAGVNPSPAQHNHDNQQMDLRYNIWGSGPIIKNHLFFYAMAQETNHTSDTYGLTTYTSQDEKTPYFLGRLDWDINSDNVLTVTGWKTTGTNDGTQYHLLPNILTGFSNTHQLAPYGGFENKTGSEALIGHYTWYATNNFHVSALYGYLRFDRATSSSTPQCPIVVDFSGPVAQNIGCWESQFQPVSPGQADARHEWKIDGEWQSGNGAGLLTGHDVTFGYTSSEFRSGGLRYYTGPLGTQLNVTNFLDGSSFSQTAAGSPIPGIEYEYFVPPGSLGTGSATNPFGVLLRQFYDHGSFKNTDKSYYIQDDWHIVPNLYLRLGVRNDSFKNYNEYDQVFANQTNNWSPRLGFSWDIKGDSTMKLYGSYSEYFIPIAANTNVRAAGGEFDNFYFCGNWSGVDPTTQAPLNPTDCITLFSQGSGQPPNPKIVVERNQKPMSEKEFILGFQNAINQDWTWSVQFMHRWLVNGADDQCWFDIGEPGLLQYVQSQGWDVTSFFGLNAPNPSAQGLMNGQFGGTGCINTNPGQDIQTYADINGSGKLTPITIPNSAYHYTINGVTVSGMPKAVRYYNAVTFQISRAFSDRWMFGASYTWSHLYGNEEGYVLTNIGQTDAGITQAFDFPELEMGAYGDLANDHRHVFKFWGAYEFMPDWRIGGNVLIESGKPLSCLGTWPDVNVSANAYGAFSYFCGQNSSNPATFPNGGVLHPQGTWSRTPWLYNLDLQLAWTPSNIPGLTVFANWFNVLGTQHPTQQSQFYDNGSATPTPVPTFMTATAFQQPTFFQFGVRYNFD